MHRAERRLSILVVGSINTDLVIGVPRLPVAGESLVGRRYAKVPGGKGANQAVAAARLGAEVTLVGRVGDDAEGMVLADQVRREGVVTTYLSRSPGKSTGLAVITVEDTGENSIILVPGANHEVSQDDVRRAMDAHYFDVLMLQLEIPEATIVAAAQLATQRQIPVVLDAGPAQSFPLEMLQGLAILTPNETEVYALTGIRPDTLAAASEASHVLKNRSKAQAIVIKLGERGALLCDADGSCELLPAHRVNVVDTTAAGDAFTAAMTIEYLRTGNLRRAVSAGNAAGALTATKPGSQPALPTAASLDAFRKSAGSHVH